MNKENVNAAKVEEPPVRMTRAQSKALGVVGGNGICPSSKPSFKQDHKRVVRVKSKRAALDERKSSATATLSLLHKRQAVLKDIANISTQSSSMDCINSTRSKIQTNEQSRRGPVNNNSEITANVSMQSLSVEDEKARLVEELSRVNMVEAQEIKFPVMMEDREPIGLLCHSSRECAVANAMLPIKTSKVPIGINSHQKKKENEASKNFPDIVDIDSDLKDPQGCSLYAPDIYNNIRITEHNQRPSIDYMERLQQDITPSMRGILIDWLVEVSEEYKLVPDTLYLTVNLIDRFLSHNYIEKRSLQLLGITCMLIASKYEEICAPRVEEFCFITDNAYTRGEVLKMESQVLNFLHFQLSVPTIKTFLRRFIQAAQTSYKVPCIELEFLANYLAELTLLQYNFLNFLPSVIAASAVFLARWTLNQSDHPWNPTLEHYSTYKATEMRTTVLALEDLQLNTSGCSLNAIREKYRQQKFKSVATMISPERVLSLFKR